MSNPSDAMDSQRIYYSDGDWKSIRPKHHTDCHGSSFVFVLNQDGYLEGRSLNHRINIQRDCAFSNSFVFLQSTNLMRLPRKCDNVAIAYRPLLHDKNKGKSSLFRFGGIIHCDGVNETCLHAWRSMTADIQDDGSLCPSIYPRTSEGDKMLRKSSWFDSRIPESFVSKEIVQYECLEFEKTEIMFVCLVHCPPSLSRKFNSIPPIYSCTLGSDDCHQQIFHGPSCFIATTDGLGTPKPQGIKRIKKPSFKLSIVQSSLHQLPKASIQDDELVLKDKTLLHHQRQQAKTYKSIPQTTHVVAITKDTMKQNEHVGKIAVPLICHSNQQDHKTMRFAWLEKKDIVDSVRKAKGRSVGVDEHNKMFLSKTSKLQEFIILDREVLGGGRVVVFEEGDEDTRTRICGSGSCIRDSTPRVWKVNENVSCESHDPQMAKFGITAIRFGLNNEKDKNDPILNTHFVQCLRQNVANMTRSATTHMGHSYMQGLKGYHSESTMLARASVTASRPALHYEQLYRKGTGSQAHVQLPVLAGINAMMNRLSQRCQEVLRWAEPILFGMGQFDVLKASKPEHLPGLTLITAGSNTSIGYSNTSHFDDSDMLLPTKKRNSKTNW